MRRAANPLWLPVLAPPAVRPLRGHLPLWGSVFPFPKEEVGFDEGSQMYSVSLGPRRATVPWQEWKGWRPTGDVLALTWGSLRSLLAGVVFHKWRSSATGFSISQEKLKPNPVFM